MQQPQHSPLDGLNFAPSPADFDINLAQPLFDGFSTQNNDGNMAEIFNSLFSHADVKDGQDLAFLNNAAGLSQLPLDPTEALYDSSANSAAFKSFPIGDEALFFQAMVSGSHEPKALINESASPLPLVSQFPDSSLLAAASTFAIPNAEDNGSLSGASAQNFYAPAQNVPFNPSDLLSTPSNDYPLWTSDIDVDKVAYPDELGQSMANFGDMPPVDFQKLHFDLFESTSPFQMPTNDTAVGQALMLALSETGSVMTPTNSDRTKSQEPEEQSQSIRQASIQLASKPAPKQILQPASKAESVPAQIPTPPSSSTRSIKGQEQTANYFPSPISSEHSADDILNKQMGQSAGKAAEAPKKKREQLTAAEKEAKARNRVLRNRAAAQESRDKKRRYVDDLETSNEKLSSENQHLSKKLQTVEENNRNLSKQVDSLASQLNAFKKMLSDASFTKVAAAASTIASLTSSLLLPDSQSSSSPLNMTLGVLSDPAQVRNRRRPKEDASSMPRMTPSKPMYRKRSHSRKKSVAPGLPSTIASMPTSPALSFEESWHVISASEDQSGDEEWTCSSNSHMSLPQRPSESVSTMTNKFAAKFISLIVSCMRLLICDRTPPASTSTSVCKALTANLQVSKRPVEFESTSAFFDYMARRHTTLRPFRPHLGIRSMLPVQPLVKQTTVY